MTTFLERILETKRNEVETLKHSHPLQSFMKTGRHPMSGEAPVPCRGFRTALESGDRLAVVAEIKQASPSKGHISKNFDPIRTAITYQQAGAAAISVLTDESYFLGSVTDLEKVRQVVRLPLLRKDFIIDELQIAEARLAGADAILLICAALSASRLAELSAYAHSLGLDTLVEVHEPHELEAALLVAPSVLGVNNRNLHTFEVSLATTATILQHTPKTQVAIAESGVHTPADASQMAMAGVHGVLVGEALMRAENDSAVSPLLDSFRVARRLREGHSHTASAVPSI
ncbi:MAG: hypothetical protein A2201_11890 [Alicyclobacillus sp. RIFOXYA1_FULL_53_8]|nr:MAG: hypothetical protein A2201_11890 [Alicyclobacillus sp. RIFOXYA1_FULL_53_8]